MFNLFFRPYVPGFRVGLDSVPGFDIDDNGVPRRAAPSFGGTLPDSASQQYPDAAQIQTPPSISVGLPGAGSWVLPTPLPGFRVSPQDDVPGFNVGPQYSAPGFNIDENGNQQQETIWSGGLPQGSATPQDPNIAQTPTRPPDVDDPVSPVSSPLPEWPYQLGTMLPPRLPTVFDPNTEPHLGISTPPGIGPAPMTGAAPWPLSIVPRQPPGIDIRSRAAAPQNINSQPAAQQAMRTDWLRLPMGGWPYAQAEGAQSPIPLARPLADSSFSLASAGDAGGQKAQRQTALQHSQQTPSRTSSALFDAGLATVRPFETQSITGFNPKSDQEFSQLIEAYRRLNESKQPDSDRLPPSPPSNENGASSYAPPNDGSPLGQRLVQSTIDTLVPGCPLPGVGSSTVRGGKLRRCRCLSSSRARGCRARYSDIRLRAKARRGRQGRCRRRSCPIPACVQLGEATKSFSREGSQGYALASHSRAKQSGSVWPAAHSKYREHRGRSGKGAYKIECVLFVKATVLGGHESASLA